MYQKAHCQMRHPRRSTSLLLLGGQPLCEQGGSAASPVVAAVRLLESRALSAQHRRCCSEVESNSLAPSIANRTVRSCQHPHSRTGRLDWDHGRNDIPYNPEPPGTSKKVPRLGKRSASITTMPNDKNSGSKSNAVGAYLVNFDNSFHILAISAWRAHEFGQSVWGEEGVFTGNKTQPTMVFCTAGQPE